MSVSPTSHQRRQSLRQRILRALVLVLRTFLHGTAILGVSITAHLLQIASFTLYPFSRPLAYRLGSSLTGTIWAVMNYIVEARCRAAISYSGDADKIPLNVQPVVRGPLPKKPAPESALIICNHLCEADWILINCLASRHNMLSHCKYFIKRSLIFVPIYGPGMCLAGFPMLQRNWSSDSKLIAAIFKDLREGEIPCWLVSFLEGTRLTPEKLSESQAFCLSKGLPVFTNVLYPRTKGFVATATALADSHIGFVYDFTIAYLHVPSNQVNRVFPSILEAHVAENLGESWRFHVHVDRIPLASVPTANPEALAAWTVERWRIKDERLAQWKLCWPGPKS